MIWGVPAGGARQRVLLFAGSHIPLVVGFLLARIFPLSVFSALVLPPVVFLLPGVILLKLPARFSWPYWVKAFAVSNGTILVMVLMARLFDVGLLFHHGWILLLGILWLGWLARPLNTERVCRRMVHAIIDLDGRKKALLVTGFVMAYISGAWVVPPQQDQDMVIANPTYGYLQHGKPYGTETRFTYIFSKPPLLHLQAGFVLLLLDSLEEAAFYAESGKMVEFYEEPLWARRQFRQRDIECFELNPHLVSATRISTILYAAVLPLLLVDLAVTLGASAGIAFAAGLLYLTLPEVFIRAGYAGFTTPSNALLAVSALLLLDKKRASRTALFLAGLHLSLLNHKTLFVPGALAVSVLLGGSWKSVLRLIRERWLWGVIVGTAVWWLYGALIDWSTFVQDHFYADFRHRFLLHDLPLGMTTSTWYPGVTGLWMEWARNFSVPLFVLGVGGVIWGMTRGERFRFLALWALIAWVLGSITDWRQTKHLMLSIVPMTVLGALLVDRLGHRLKRVIGAVCLVAVAYNLVRIVILWADFDSLPPSTIW